MGFHSSMKVSVMKEAQLPQVARLSDQLGYPVSLDEISHRWKRLSSNERHALFVCEETDNLIGWIHLECVEDFIEEDKVEIKAIVVDESARGKGAGRALMNAAEKWAKTYHLHTIYLNCNTIRTRTHKFYQREGFTNYKTSLFFEKKI